ncbi:MAG: hypothetical protein U9Q34_02990, partial [Elusimicrobiota bacterium]|nr:hypothetical protein [Elusimicrobiota bacterium]
MTKFFIFLIQIIVLCGISFAYDLPLSTAAHKVNFVSDEAYFFDDNKTIVLKGRVKLDEIENKILLR